MKHIIDRFSGAARRIGIPVDEYIRNVGAGLKRCSGPRKHWVPLREFTRNKTAADGLSQVCRACLRDIRESNATNNRQSIVHEALKALNP